MSHGALKHTALQNAAVRAAYEALGPEFEILRQMFQARQAVGLTQAQVAERMGTKPPAVTRLEASLSKGEGLESQTTTCTLPA